MTEKKFAVVWECDGTIVGNEQCAIFNTRVDAETYIRGSEGRSSFKMLAKVVPVVIKKEKI